MSYKNTKFKNLLIAGSFSQVVFASWTNLYDLYLLSELTFTIEPANITSPK